MDELDIYGHYSSYVRAVRLTISRMLGKLGVSELPYKRKVCLKYHGMCRLKSLHIDGMVVERINPYKNIGKVGYGMFCSLEDISLITLFLSSRIEKERIEKEFRLRKKYGNRFSKNPPLAPQ